MVIIFVDTPIQSMLCISTTVLKSRFWKRAKGCTLSTVRNIIIRCIRLRSWTTATAMPFSTSPQKTACITSWFPPPWFPQSSWRKSPSSRRIKSVIWTEKRARSLFRTWTPCTTSKSATRAFPPLLSETYAIT